MTDQCSQQLGNKSTAQLGPNKGKWVGPTRTDSDLGWSLVGSQVGSNSAEEDSMHMILHVSNFIGTLDRVECRMIESFSLLDLFS